MSRRTAGTVLVLIGAFLFLFLTMEREPIIFDEGIVLVNAMRVHVGEIVHRDFYSNYSPGAYWAVAALSRLTADTFLIARCYGVAVMAGIVAVQYHFLGGRTRWWIAALGPLIGLCWMLSIPSYLCPSFPCALLAPIGAAILIRPGGAERPGPLFAAGLCAGISTYFRYDAGFFTLSAYCLAIIAYIALDGRPRATPRLLRACVICGLGAGALILPGAIAFLAVAPIQSFYADVIDLGMHIYPKVRHLPFPGPWDLLRHPAQIGIYSPMMTAVLSIALAVPEMRANRGEDRDTARMPPLLPLGLLSAILCYEGSVTPVPLHMLLGIVSSVAAAMLCADRLLNMRGRWVAAGVAVILITVVPAITGAQSQLRVRRPFQYMAGPWLLKPSPDPAATLPEACLLTPGMRGAWMMPYYVKTARFIDQNTAPGEKIYVGLTSHEHIFANALILYFAADRLPMTHWAQLDPGVETRATTQAEMVAEFETARPRLIVRDATFETMNGFAGMLPGEGVHTLDRYLDAHYRPVAQSATAQVWMRNDVPAPRLDVGPPLCRMEAPQSPSRLR